jgi:hypothetical protein
MLCILSLKPYMEKIHLFKTTSSLWCGARLFPESSCLPLHVFFLVSQSLRTSPSCINLRLRDGRETISTYDFLVFPQKKKKKKKKKKTKKLDVSVVVSKNSHINTRCVGVLVGGFTKIISLSRIVTEPPMALCHSRKSQ